MTRESRDIIGEQCVRNDIKETWREHYNHLLNVEFDWNREGLEAAKPVLGP